MNRGDADTVVIFQSVEQLNDTIQELDNEKSTRMLCTALKRVCGTGHCAKCSTLSFSVGRFSQFENARCGLPGGVGAADNGLAGGPRHRHQCQSVEQLDLSR